MSELYHTAVQLPLFVFCVCTGCHTEKALVDFPIDRRRENEHRTRCSFCWNTQERAQTARTREQHNAYEREQRARNPEHSRALRHFQYLSRRKQRCISIRKWNQSNPLRKREIVKRRRARKQEATIGRVSYKRILERDGYWCYICGRDIDPLIKKGTASLTFDHKLPLAGHGGHSEDNIRPAHRCCNQRKGMRLLEEMTLFQRRGPD